jgi:hypothetical protein
MKILYINSLLYGINKGQNVVEKETEMQQSIYDLCCSSTLSSGHSPVVVPLCHSYPSVTRRSLCCPIYHTGASEHPPPQLLLVHGSNLEHIKT